MMQDIEMFLAATVEDKADATLALVSMLIGTLVQSEQMEANEAQLLAATAAEACRSFGNQRAAALIHHMFPGSEAVDVDGEAAKRDVNIERVARQ